MQKIQSGNQVVMKPRGNRHDARNVIAKDERDCITKKVQKILHGPRLDRRRGSEQKIHKTNVIFGGEAEREHHADDGYSGNDKTPKHFKSWWWWWRRRQERRWRKPNIKTPYNVHTPRHVPPPRNSQQMINWMEFFADITGMHSQFSSISQCDFFVVLFCCFAYLVFSIFLVIFHTFYSFRSAYWASKRTSHHVIINYLTQFFPTIACQTQTPIRITQSEWLTGWLNEWMNGMNSEWRGFLILSLSLNIIIHLKLPIWMACFEYVMFNATSIGGCYTTEY